jgi:calcium-dependent protein kinase
MDIYQIFNTETSLKVVMEIVQGGQLLNLIKKKPNMTWEEISLIIKQILSGLSFLHQRHIMHRDIKPENILIRSSKPIDLVISDFGLA